MDSPNLGMILESWKAIAAYLGRNIRTCQLWEKDLGLPIHRLDGSSRARVFAYADELDRWFRDKLQERQAGIKETPDLPVLPRWSVRLIASLLALAAGAIGISAWLLQRQAQVRWANDVAIPEIEQLMTMTEFEKTADLAFRAQRYIPRSARLARLITQVTSVLSVTTDPPGAKVSIDDYADTVETWRPLGQTPLERFRTAPGYKRWRIEKPGYVTTEGALGLAAAGSGEIRVRLAMPSEIPVGMVRINGGTFSPFLTGLAGLDRIDLGDYFMDKTEVTNAQFQKFVDAGGYQTMEFWKHAFVENGRDVLWEEAMREFVDRTGRPGPAAWWHGRYPEGQEDVPVSGVSWYEAAAYAEFVGKKLPSLYHWNRAAFLNPDYTFTVSYCNFDGRGPAPVARFRSLGPFGTYDMAGNVKEWCANEIGGRRLILGGAWNDVQYMSFSADRYPPFFRAENFGFRCMKPEPGQDDPPGAYGPVADSRPLDLAHRKPCSDEVFEILRSLYSYVKTNLDPRVESRLEWSETTRVEKVTYTDASGENRVGAYLFIPRQGRPPFQTIVYCPGGMAWRVDSVFQYGNVQNGEVELFNRMGRAFVIPVLPGTFERRAGESIFEVSPLDSSQRLRRFVAGVYWDIARCLDYLETRPDIDSENLAFQSLSFGAWLSPLVGALERRFKAQIILAGGLESWTYRANIYAAETDMINFLPRVKVPVLMQHGRYDISLPLVRSLFDLLGTPEKDKRLLLYNTGHSIWFTNEIRKDTMEFLDRYLGLVDGDSGRGQAEQSSVSHNASDR